MIIAEYAILPPFPTESGLEKGAPLPPFPFPLQLTKNQFLGW
jgi:hypothetical protein